MWQISNANQEASLPVTYTENLNNHFIQGCLCCNSYLNLFKLQFNKFGHDLVKFKSSEVSQIPKMSSSRGTDGNVQRTSFPHNYLQFLKYQSLEQLCTNIYELLSLLFLFNFKTVF